MRYRVIEREIDSDEIKAYVNSADGNAADCLNRCAIRSAIKTRWRVERLRYLSSEN